MLIWMKIIFEQVRHLISPITKVILRIYHKSSFIKQNAVYKVEL